MLFVFFVTILVGGCRGADDGAQSLTVFAAASLTEAFTELGTHFEAAHPGMTVTFNFAGSQQLAQQLGQGAPGDVFASANAQQMALVVENGRIAPDAPVTFARNRLVVIFPTDNPADLQALPDLAWPGVRLVLAEAAVPVGRYTLDFLDKAAADATLGPAFHDGVLANVVSYEQNVRTVFTKVALGEADAGIVYSSDVVGTGSEAVAQIAIPDELNVSATYPIAPLADAQRPFLAQQFIDFVLSDEGQAILASYGFIGR